MYKRQNVYTTVNVQHLESLNDVVASITGLSLIHILLQRLLSQGAAVILVSHDLELDVYKRQT